MFLGIKLNNKGGYIDKYNKGKVNMFLGIKSNNKGGYIDNLLANTDMSFPDKYMGMMDTLNQVTLENLGLQL